MANLRKMAKLTKLEDFMQMTWLRESIESGGFGENGRFGKNSEINWQYFRQGF